MKKKTYIIPEVTLFKVESERICALSDLNETGGGTQLTKDSGDWDIWGEGSDDDYDYDDEY